MKNSEGYPDPTAGKVIKRADRPPENVVHFRMAVAEEVYEKYGVKYKVSD